MRLPVLGTREQEHVSLWKQCVRCQIGETARSHVFWRGTLPCDVLFIGEGPGQTEDLTGKPFMGRAGRLFNEWVSGLPPLLSWAVTNVVACRPCDGVDAPNRPPTGLEIAKCRPRLEEFILQMAKPRVVVLLGRTARLHSPRGPYPCLELTHPAGVNYKGGSGCPDDLLQREKLRAFVEKEIR